MLFLVLIAVPCQVGLFGQGSVKKVQAIFDGEVKKPIHYANLSGDDYFAVRDVAQAYGSSLVYHPVTGKVALLMNNRRIDIYVKSTRVLLDGQKKRLSIPSRLVSGELYIPASFVLSNDFAGFSGAVSQYNPNSGFLTMRERSISIHLVSIHRSVPLRSLSSLPKTFRIIANKSKRVRCRSLS